MDWLATSAQRRSDPRALWRDVRSVIMLGVNYGSDGDPLAVLQERDRAAISVYAQGDDYHEVIKPRLKRLARWLIAKAGGDVKVFVDTAAVMEKPLAQRAGLGWQGKHTNLVSREFGSWLFLGAIFTTLELPADAADEDHCGSCQACLDICPTNAFPAPYQLDPRRCISYLTIEHKGPIPREFRAAMGNRIYGCDDCLAVCPWNKFAQAGRETKLVGTGGAGRTGAGRTCDARRRAFPCAVRKDRDQAHRARPLHPQCADRDRQFRRAGACTQRDGAAGRSLAAGARRRGLGVVAIAADGRISGAGAVTAIGRSRPRCARRMGHVDYACLTLPSITGPR